MSRKVNLIRCVIAVTIALLLVSCATSGGGRDIAPASITGAGHATHAERPVVGLDAGLSAAVDNRLEVRAYVLANRARREAGLAPLEMRYDLVRLARRHAKDMARRDFFSHTNPDGDGPGERAREDRVRYSVLAENLARVRYSDEPAALAVEGWLESPGHRRNLLDETAANYCFTGVGVVRREDGTVLLSQVFLR